MPRGREPQGDESRIVVVSTKVTATERDRLVSAYGSTYSAVREAVERLLSDQEEAPSP